MASIDVRYTGVLFIDFQHDVCARGGRMVSQSEEVIAGFEAVRARAGWLLEQLRDLPQGKPHYAFVAHGFESGYPELVGGRLSPFETYVIQSAAFERGTAGTAQVPELIPTADEHVFWKQTLSPFESSNLGYWLNKRGVDTLAIAGVVAHYAVLATALAAFDRGFRVLVVEDCCASSSRERHDMALEILEPLCELVTAEDLQARLYDASGKHLKASRSASGAPGAVGFGGEGAPGSAASRR
ncbi:MAG: isochorismatase family cysteine hydrolase [Polyangiaceae bacterium]